MENNRGTKRRMGFNTSASELQEEYDSITSLIREDRMSWSNLLSQLENEFKEDMAEARDAIKNKSIQLLIFKCSRLQYLQTVRLISIMGGQVTGIEERITKLEKLIKDISLHTR